MWQIAVAKVLMSMYQGQESAKRGDRDADAIEDLIPSTLLTAKANKAAVTKEKYADTLSSKDIISGEITDTRIQAKVESDKIVAETGGSGVLADTGGTLDTQMALINQSRKQEDMLMTQMSMLKAKNSWEATEERKSIDRYAKMEVQRLTARAKSVRQGGKDAKSRAYLLGGMSAAESYFS